MRTQARHQVRPLRPLPRLPRLSRMQLHHAARGRDAGPLPEVRRTADEAHGQEPEDRQAVHLLLLRVRHEPRRGEEVRLHDVGRAHQGRLPRLRTDDVQEGGQGLQEAVLHQPRV